jgi:hypothetical protein
MLDSRETGIDLNEEESMLVQLLVALIGEAIFGAVTARHHAFRAEMERRLEGRPAVRVDKTPPPPR